MLEIFGVITGLLYMALEVRQHRAMWVVGFVTSLVYVFVFFSAKIYAYMGLQVYYVLISIYGFWLWNRKRTVRTEEEAPVGDHTVLYRRANLPVLAGILSANVAFFLIIYFLLAYLTDSPVPIGDAITTSMGIVATWMLARRIVEHWYFWIVVNLASIYISYIRDLYPTMFLYLCYTVISVAGLYTWLKKGVKTDDKTL